MLLFKTRTKTNTYCKTPSDYWIINIFDQEEVNWWCRELKCSEQELINVVNRVGDSTCKVKEYLGEY